MRISSSILTPVGTPYVSPRHNAFLFKLRLKRLTCHCIDFTSLFNWNTKQLFVYVLATYPSHDPLTIPPSEAVIWDLIIPSSSQIHPFNPIQFLWSKNTALPPKSRKPISSKAPPKAGPAPGVISLRNAKPKYQITDISGLIAEKDNVTLEVGWNVQPWVGALTWANTEGRFGGKWKALQGGRSQPFDLPPLKGKTSSTAKRAETPRAAEASPIL